MNGSTTRVSVNPDGTIVHLDADVVLRSSEGANFRVMKAILSCVSPIFNDMFELPNLHNGLQPASVDDLPIVELHQDTRTLAHLLSYIYPGVQRATFGGVEHLRAVLAAAKMYCMDTVVDALQDTVRTLALDKPLQIIALAWELGLSHDIIRVAARRCLEYPLDFMSPLSLAELKDLPMTVYLEICLRYRQRCVEAALLLLSDLRWTLKDVPLRRWKEMEQEMIGPSGACIRIHYDYPERYTWFKCGLCAADQESITPRNDSSEKFTPRLWWIKYVENVRAGIVQRPAGMVATDVDVMEPALRQAASCAICGPCAFKELNEFSNELATRINLTTDKVPLELPE